MEVQHSPFSQTLRMKMSEYISLSLSPCGIAKTSIHLIGYSNTTAINQRDPLVATVYGPVHNDLNRSTWKFTFKNEKVSLMHLSGKGLCLISIG